MFDCKEIAYASHSGVNNSLQKSVVEAVMPQLILMGILYITIALLYAKCIPERFDLHSTVPNLTHKCDKVF